LHRFLRQTHLDRWAAAAHDSVAAVPALYFGLIALGLADCLAPLAAHLVAGGQVPPVRDLVQVPLMLAFGISGLAYGTRPGQRAVRRLLATSVAALTAGALGHFLSAYYLSHGVPSWGWLADSADILCQQLVGVGWVALLAVFPDGRYQRRYERWAVGLVTAGALLVPPLILVTSPRLPADGVFLWSSPQPTSPIYLPWLGWAHTALPLPVGVLLGVALLGLRHLRSRASGPDLRWPLMVVSLFVTLPAANALVLFGLLGRDAFIGWTVAVFSFVTAALAIGLVRFHLFDVELVIRRSLVYGVAWSAIALTYAGLAAAFGLATALHYQVVVAILVTIAATIAFQPARAMLERLADRLVYGRRLQGWELVKHLGAAFGQTVELEAVGSRLAQAVAAGMGASWVDVYVGREDATGASFERVGRAGSPFVRGQPALVQPLSHAGEMVGKIETGPAAQGDYRAQDRELLAAIGQQAALAIRNARLAAELAASRARLVQAQEVERRRVERDLHDGVQQQLVSLLAGIRSARTQLVKHPDRTDARLEDLQEEAHQALRDLRRVVSGIHPAVLSDHGLATAVRARISRLPIGVGFECADALFEQRFSEDVESTAYFVISEGLTNVLKHSGSDAAEVKLVCADGHLRIEVRDEGRGFSLGTTSASGLQGLRDRVEALGGRLTVDSSPGAGTRLVATLKMGAAGYG
jgi:signal transduction histidine kinase